MLNPRTASEVRPLLLGAVFQGGRTRFAWKNAKTGERGGACEDIIKSERESPKIELSKMRFQVMKQFGRIAKWGAVAFCVAFIAIQLVPVNRTNPPVQGDFRGSAEVVSILRRACYDCHSNETVWPWYSRVAPLSWVIAHDVNEGRAVVEFFYLEPAQPRETS